MRGTLAGGRSFELMEFGGEGISYYITNNANAAISTAADRIRNTAPYNVNGNGFIVGVWDGGAVMSNHQEFGVRVLIKDGAGVSDHATHVAGTIGAAGVVAQAQGMAPNVGIDSYDWTNDLAEMAGRAATAPNQAGTIYLSNHSYGFVRGWETGSFSGASGPHWFGTAGDREDRNFGRYDTNAVNLDALHYSAPYYLAFKSAGNDRNDAAPTSGTTFYYVSGGFWVSKTYNPATDPFADGWDNGGFDTIEQQAAAKNIMTVGAVNDAVSGGVRSPAAGTMASFSNWGPTDDGRIKPDIVANGVGLYSSINTSVTSYASYSGTSMSSPNAAGTAALLIDYYNELFPAQAMRASTLKGLMIHTATDVGNPGPDYSYGWGLINAEAAALQIKAHFDAPARRFLYEGALSTASPSETYYFDWNGTSPIRATVCWTDPAGTAKSGLDNRTPALVNDLDVRIIDPSGFQVYYPFVLDVNNPANLAVVGDNVVDNVEQVVVPAPVSGTYRIVVSHKGVLSGGLQTYSLILNGQSLTPPATRIIGLSGNLAFGNVVVGATGQQTLTIANTGNATLTVSGITYPAGFSGNWAGGTIAAGASQPVTVTFAPVAAQAYGGTITVNSDATSGTNTIAASGTGTTGGASTAFVTSFVSGTVRNNYSGWVGLQLTVGASPLTVSELGRLMLSGNSGTHTVKLVKASDGQDVAGGAVSLAMSGGTVGQIKYATLANPVVLASNTAYFLMTEETFGGDTWCDLNTTVTTTSVAAVNTAVYGSGPGAWFPIAGANQTYGPVSLKYGGGGGGTTRIIGLSGNLAFGSVTVGATAQQTLTIANTGNATLTVSGITYPAGFSGNWAGGTIAAGASQPVTVTFAPVAAQAYGGTITVNSDATSGTNTIAASGTGTTGGAATAFVTSFVAGTVRNNFTGWVGLQLTVGASPLTVSELGRLMLSGNSGTHTLKLVKASDGQDVAGGAVSLAMSGGTVGQIKYATLASPVVLAANTAYFLMTQETSGGDTWCDLNTTVTTTSVAAVNTAVYGSGPGAWFSIGGANQTYGPVSLKYGGGGGGTTRIIGLSGNLAFGNVTVGATAQQTLTIANTGNATLTVSGITYPAGFSGNWAGGTIAAGASQPVTVTFAPTAAQAYGGTITVNSDATSGTNMIAASGTGTTGGAATAFVTSFVSGTVRNNYTGWVGLQFTVGASQVTVSELGRLMLSGNSGTHTVKLVKASDGQDVAGGSVSLAMSGGTVGQIKYATLASPVVLAANTAYYLLTQETSGGDTWCDLNTTVTTTSVAAVNTAVYGSGPGAWFPIAGANQTYGPVSLKYGGGGGGTTRIIGLSGNLAFGNVTVGATAQQTLTIANTGNATLTVSGITYPAGFSGNWAGGTIAAGASQPVTVTFAPTAAQVYGGTITVNSDATSGTNTIAASGTGTTGGAATAFVTSFVAGTVRNNYTGWVGLQFTVGASPVTVSELGRLMLSGNSGTHTVKLVKASDGQDVAGGSVSLAMSGGTVGQIKYATLASPVVLAANTAYLLLTEETFGGDTWYDVNTTVATTSVAAVTSAAYGTGPGAWFTPGGPNQTYGPVSFKY